MQLNDLKKKTPAELLVYAEQLEVENASSLRTQDLMYAILKQLADMYGVGVDYILNEHSEEVKEQYRSPRPELNNKLIISLLACLSVWILATILYINFKIIFNHYYWIIWNWALPVTGVVLIVFSSIFCPSIPSNYKCHQGSHY